MTLEVRSLSFSYPGSPPLLCDITFQVPRGKVVSLLGPSGSGKTTILRCISGLERRYAGEVLWEGVVLDPLPPHRRRIGMIFQEPALFPHLDVLGNVVFGMRYADPPVLDPLREGRLLLELVGLSGKEQRRVDELSGGERQRVALARALGARPRAILLDEPLSALDRDLREDLGPKVADLLRMHGVPAVWVTHDKKEARQVADSLYTLEKGVLRESPP